MKETFADRQLKNKKLLQLNQYLLSKLKTMTIYDTKSSKNLPVNLTTWQPNIGNVLKNGWNFIIFPGGDQIKVLLNTLMFSIVYKLPDETLSSLCNTKLRDELDRRDIIISLGSACNKGASSYVIASMNAPQRIINGIIRISLGDSNTKKEIDDFIIGFSKSISTVQFTVNIM